MTHTENPHFGSRLDAMEAKRELQAIVTSGTEEQICAYTALVHRHNRLNYTDLAAYTELAAEYRALSGQIRAAASC